MPRHSPCALSSLNLHELRKSRWRFFFSVCSIFYHFWLRNNLYFVILFVIDANIVTYLLLDLLLLHLFYSVFKVQLVGSSGLEPPTSRLSGARSSLLSYEPLYRLFFSLSPLVEMKRFELLTPCLQGRCSPNWATPPYHQGFCVSEYHTLKIEQPKITYLRFVLLS